MSFVRTVFDTFSERSGPQSSVLPVEVITKQRVSIWWKDLFTNRSHVNFGNYYFLEAWKEIRRVLLMRHARIWLCKEQFEGHEHREVIDTITFVTSTTTVNFLDFLEDLFHLDALNSVRPSKPEIVGELNDLLHRDNSPYFLTDYIETFGERGEGRFRGTVVNISYPKVILRESEVLHQSTIEPTLHLLQNPIFTSANSEYLNALEDYRKQDYADCLTKCCSAFESVLKIVCDKKGWPYDQKDTAGRLIDIYLREAGLAIAFKEPMLIIPRLRNELSSAHGAGVELREAEHHVAQLMINQTASWILFAVQNVGI